MSKMKQKKILLTIMFLAFTSMLLTSCYPDYGLTTSDFDIVATFKEDAATIFRAYRTFYMPDSIKRLTDNGGSRMIRLNMMMQILTKLKIRWIALWIYKGSK